MGLRPIEVWADESSRIRLRGDDESNSGPIRYKRFMTSRRMIDLLRHGEPGDTVTLSGWVRTKRELKEFAFLEVNDGSIYRFYDLIR